MDVPVQASQPVSESFDEELNIRVTEFIGFLEIRFHHHYKGEVVYAFRNSDEDRAMMECVLLDQIQHMIKLGFMSLSTRV